jgi:nicotinamide riboside transporter PnuC
MILGREPALWAGLAKAAIITVATFIFPLTTDQQGVLNALVAAVLGLVVAFAVSAEKAVPFLLGLLEAIIAVAVSFGANLPPTSQLVVMGLAAAIVAMFTRTQVVAPIPAAPNR